MKKLQNLVSPLVFHHCKLTRRRGPNLINIIGITFDLVAPLVLILSRKKHSVTHDEQKRERGEWRGVWGGYSGERKG